MARADGRARWRRPAGPPRPSAAARRQDKAVRLRLESSCLRRALEFLGFRRFAGWPARKITPAAGQREQWPGSIFKWPLCGGGAKVMIMIQMEWIRFVSAPANRSVCVSVLFVRSSGGVACLLSLRLAGVARERAS
jgi:hypothetical protein